jgi:hypothetical protein
LWHPVGSRAVLCRDPVVSGWYPNGCALPHVVNQLCVVSIKEAVLYLIL